MSIIYPLSIPGLPSTPGMSKANLIKKSAVGESIGEFDGSAQQQQWADQHWELDLEWPEMTWAQFAALDAFAGALRGKIGSFLFTPPLATAPRGLGLAAGSPICGVVSTGGGGGGPNNCVAAGNGSGIHGVWTNDAGMLNATSGYATCLLALGQSSVFLICQGFGFSIPAGAVILGILVTVTGYASTSTQSLGATLSSDGIALTPWRYATPTTGPTVLSFGSLTDLWNYPYPWSPALINNSIFGVNFQAYQPGHFYMQNALMTVALQLPNQAGGNILYTSAWMPNQSGVLLPGDYFGLTVAPTLPRLYQYVGQSPLDTDGGGNATLDIFPFLREAPGPSGGQPLILLNPQGTFRGPNVINSPAQRNKTLTFAMKCREAI